MLWCARGWASSILPGARCLWAMTTQTSGLRRPPDEPAIRGSGGIEGDPARPFDLSNAATGL
jgi:hypothetical protein